MRNNTLSHVLIAAGGFCLGLFAKEVLAEIQSRRQATPTDLDDQIIDLKQEDTTEDATESSHGDNGWGESVSPDYFSQGAVSTATMSKVDVNSVRIVDVERKVDEIARLVNEFTKNVAASDMASSADVNINREHGHEDEIEDGVHKSD